jgi:hypothetical protein
MSRPKLKPSASSITYVGWSQPVQRQQSQTPVLDHQAREGGLCRECRPPQADGNHGTSP